MGERLYRSRKDKVIAGVCGGIAENLEIDPLWVRLVAVILIFVHGLGILLYIVAWILMPENPAQKSTTKTKAEKAVTRMKPKSDRGIKALGVLLIVLGTIFLVNRLFRIEFIYIVAVLMILSGVLLFQRRGK